MPPFQKRPLSCNSENRSQRSFCIWRWSFGNEKVCCYQNLVLLCHIPSFCIWGWITCISVSEIWDKHTKKQNICLQYIKNPCWAFKSDHEVGRITDLCEIILQKKKCLFKILLHMIMKLLINRKINFLYVQFAKNFRQASLLQSHTNSP